MSLAADRIGRAKRELARIESERVEGTLPAHLSTLSRADLAIIDTATGAFAARQSRRSGLREPV